MKKHLSPVIFIVVIFCSSFHVCAQVGISTDGSVPDNSAMLDVKSSSRGVLLPRMTNQERDAITNPVPGLMIYNSEEKQLQIYEGPFWRSLYSRGCEPPPPGSITGSGFSGCHTTGTYSTADVPYASSYFWTVPTGAVIANGQGTLSITVDFGITGGMVSVRAESGCGNSAFTDFPVTVAVPQSPDSIYGNSHPDCGETGSPYHVNPVQGASGYHWTVTSNATITSGQGTESITVDFATAGGEIGVRSENTCGGSNYKTLAYVIGIPEKPGSITGSQSPYKNATGVPYSISPVPGASSYHWTVPADAVIVTGQGSAAITVNIGNQVGNISARAENTCGNSSYTDLLVIPFSCGDMITDFRDSHTYPTVQIGTQCWMGKNMNIGTRINLGINQSQQSPEIIEKYCYTNFEDSCSVYGGLYQWNELMQYSTVAGAQGICPSGWHVPSDAEWCNMENYIDPDTVDCMGETWRGTDAGGRLKEAGTTHWSSPNTGATNTSGFTALAAGSIIYGTAQSIRQSAFFWTSTLSVNSSEWAVARYLAYNKATIFRHPNFYKTSSYSVRCIK